MQTLTRDTPQTKPLQVDTAEVAARTNGHTAVRPVAVPSTEDDITTALNLQDFRTWLMRLGARAAGKAGETDSCPIARYLNWTTGHAVSVLGRSIIYEDGAIRRHMSGPEWVRYFVFLVDEGSLSSESISAVKCLELLDTIRA